VRTTYSVEPSNVPALELPLDLDVGEGVHALLKRQGDSLRLVVDYPVNPSALALEPNSGWQEALPNGDRRNIAAVRVPAHAGVRASDVIASLTFLTDVALTFSATGPAELVSDTDEDTALLNQFGTRQVYRETRALPGMRTFPEIVIDNDAVRALIPKTAGLRLYGDALAAATDDARYRDFWRVLESAFGQQSKQLVNTVAAYPPARELGFTKDELQELKELRGGVSHGMTSSEEAAELARVREQRLKSLVERVILTKKTWGTPDFAVEELTPATSWVGPNGKVVLRAP
jgi:hypothetical protein